MIDETKLAQIYCWLIVLIVSSARSARRENLTLSHRRDHLQFPEIVKVAAMSKPLMFEVPVSVDGELLTACSVWELCILRADSARLTDEHEVVDRCICAGPKNVYFSSPEGIRAYERHKPL